MATYYKHTLPSKEELVIGRVVEFKAEASGSWKARLLAYGDLEGLVFFPKLRRRRFMNLTRQAHTSPLPFYVQDVDPVRGTVTLLYARLNEEETAVELEEFSYLEKINRLPEGLVNTYQAMREKEGEPLLTMEECADLLKTFKEATVWKLLEEHREENEEEDTEEETMKALYYRILVENFEALLPPPGLFPASFLPLARKILEKKVPKPKLSWKMAFYLCTYSEEGVELLKKVLEGFQQLIETGPCQGKLILDAFPQYSLELISDNPEALEEVKHLVKEKLEEVKKEGQVYVEQGEETQRVL